MQIYIIMNIDIPGTIKLTIIAVILNLIIPHAFEKMASHHEVKPPKGAHKLSMKSQLMHIFVHHAQIPISGSIIVALIVILSKIIADNF